MSKLDQAAEDFTGDAVPEDRTVTGLHISVILIGSLLSIPALLSGAEIGLAAGFTDGILSFALGGVILSLIGGCTAYVGAKSRLSTYVITQFAFGRDGAQLANLVMGIAILGWFGVTLATFADAASQAAEQLMSHGPGRGAFLVLGSAAMIGTTMIGFRALDKLAHVAVPLVVILLMVLLYRYLDAPSVARWSRHAGTGMNLGIATSAVVGGAIVGIVLLPDICRFARRGRDGIVAAILCFAVAQTLILAMAAIPSLATGRKDILVIMAGLGLGVPAFFAVIMATWTTNASNLYSGSLMLATLFTKIRRWKLTVVAGAIGVAISSLGIIDHFISFLLVLGVAIPPIGAIYVADYFFVRRRHYDVALLASVPRTNMRAFVAWFAGLAAGFATASDHIRLSGIPSCDAMAAALLAYVALSVSLRDQRAVRLS